jgi:hypothetical protein
MLLLIKPFLRSQHTDSAAAASSSPDDIVNPVADCEAPVSGDHDTAHDVDNLDQETDKAVTALVDSQQDRLNVVLEENAGDVSLVDRLALLRHGVLVGENRPRVDAVYGGHNGKVVLKLVEVARGCVDSAIEGVNE